MNNDTFYEKVYPESILFGINSEKYTLPPSRIWLGIIKKNSAQRSLIRDLELWRLKKGARKNYMIDTTAENPLDNYGALTDPFPDSSPGYNFKRIREYCREKGKEFSELTYEEFDMFKSIV